MAETKKRGRPPGTGTLPKPKVEEELEPNEEEYEDPEEEEEEEEVKPKAINSKNTAKKGSKAPTKTTNKAKATTKPTTTNKPTTTTKPTATTKPPAATTDVYGKGLKELQKIKPIADLYIQISYQTITVTIAPTVKSDFLGLLADAFLSMGFQFNRYGRTAYISGLTPNYDMSAVLKAVENAAALYGLKTETSGEAPTTDAADLQQRLAAIVYSLLPATQAA